MRAGCLIPGKLLGGWWAPEWGRFFWSPWLHADELHLFYNMSSLLWKVGPRPLNPAPHPLGHPLLVLSSFPSPYGR